MPHRSDEKAVPMHEMSLTRDVLDTVLTQTAIAGAQHVVSVHLKVGEIHDIIDDLFACCFAYLARGTAAGGAHVRIERVPLTVRCRACGTVYPLDQRDPATWDCPTCGAHDYTVHSGTEFAVDDIEVTGELGA